MKNKYEILGVNQNATRDEINKVYTDAFNEYKAKKLEGSVTDSEKAEMIEKSKAYQTLFDDKARSTYDELIGVKHDENLGNENKASDLKEAKNLDVKQDKGWFAKHKTKLVTGALIVAVGVGAFIVGRSTSKSNEKEEIVPTNAIVDVNNTPKPTNEIVVTPEPIVEVKQEVNRPALTLENFETESSKISEELSSKGLDIRPEFIDGTLRIINQSYFSNEDIAQLFGEDYNVVDDIEKSLTVMALIASHNHTNILENRISYAQFSYDNFDYEMLDILDQMTFELAEEVQSNTSDSDKIDNIMQTIEAFIVRNGKLQLSTGNYAKTNLSPGAGLLAERMCVEMTDIYNAYNNSLITLESEKLVQSNIVLEDVSDELNQLRISLEDTLSSDDVMENYQILISGYNDTLTEEQKMALQPILELINRQILIQNIKTSTDDSIFIPHIRNFDYTECLEDETMTR